MKMYNEFVYSNCETIAVTVAVYGFTNKNNERDKCVTSE